mgnify:FL=1
MRDHSQHIQLSRDEAVSRMLAAVDETPGGFGWSKALSGEEAHACEVGRKCVEQVSLEQSVGRVLAYDVTSRCDTPSALTCGMDSIALHWSDFEGLAEGELPDTSAWVRGVDWQFANTGVAMPEGFDTAIVIEHVQVSDDQQHVTIDAAPSKQGAGTRPAGSTRKRGDMLAAAGTVVTPDVAARIGSGDNAVVPVVRKPRVAFIPTGNELVPAGVPLDPTRVDQFAARGRNFETNSILVRAKVEAWGGQFIPFDIVCDERPEIEAAIKRACEVADIVVLNAGSSKGSDDWSCEVMEEMGRMICHQTSHGPGHHSSYAVVDNVPIVGISGPSGGASFTLDFYLRPVMRKFLGLDPIVPKTAARLAASFPAPKHGPGAKGKGKPAGEERPPEHPEHEDGKPEFFGIRPLVVAPNAEGVLEARPVDGRPGSQSAWGANAYAMIGMGPGIEPPAEGDIIEVEFI